MSWFFSRRKSKTEKPERRGLEGLVPGIHRAPALGALHDEIRRSSPEAVLDLGPSSTDSVVTFSPFCDNIRIVDLFGNSAAGDGMRSEIFRFERDAADALPDGGESFDVVLLWDFLHYFERADLKGFVERLSGCCRPGALIYLLASAVAPVPLTPIHFKFHGWDELEYDISSEDRAPCPHLVTRDVEMALADFEPRRSFQLRNGLQEFLFRYRAPSKREAADAVEGQVAEVEESPFLFD